MNLNQRIDELRGDGIPGYNAKINQLVRTVNWLMGMRTINGRQVRESDGGPVFDLNPATAQNSGQPWATDPDGNRAGWSLITCLNLQTNQSFQTWIWTGQTPQNVQPIPWMFDPSNNQAGWIVCADNTTWGTGHCGGSGGNFQYANNVISPVSPNLGASPGVQTSNPQSPPLIIPTSGTAIYLATAQWNPDPNIGSPATAPGPWFNLSNGLGSGSASFSWTFNVTYDGTNILSASGSGTAVSGISNWIYLPTTGWIFDPGSLPGYSQGNKRWIYEYNGPISPSNNPQVIQTFAFSGPLMTVSGWPSVVYLES